MSAPSSGSAMDLSQTPELLAQAAAVAKAAAELIVEGGTEEGPTPDGGTGDDHGHELGAAAPAPGDDNGGGDAEGDEDITWVTHHVVVNPEPPANILTVTLPSRYTDVRNISEGTYGAVVSAVDSRTGDQVAIKKMKDPWRTPVHALRTFREIRLLRYMQDAWPTAAPRNSLDDEHFQHQEIVGLLDAFYVEEDGDQEERDGHATVYLVMEHGGIDLGQVYKKWVIPPASARFFAYQMLRALLFMHSANLVHRDLKPSNIVVNPVTNDIKVVDFGLSRSDTSGTMTGYVATRYYRAPEVILSWQRYTNSIDMWSFGCILAEMLMKGRTRTLLRGRDYLDQLRLIGRLLGRPDAETYARLGDKQQQWVLDNILEETEPLDFRTDPRWAPPAGEPVDELAIDLVEKCLRWDDQERITAAEAICHPYFAEHGDEVELHDPDDEPVATLPFDDSFEEWELTAEEWRERIRAECEDFAKHRPY
mmetsp:Transcript_8637/g.22313  ORF Transcript_8637/g.22313 Transcript_8637/m.22313 type:complete len:478 (+) Transcript_8637:286-1719(+)